MDDKVWRREVLGVGKRVPDLVVLAVVPDGAVLVLLNEPDFVRGVGAELVELAVVRDDGLEPAAEVVALDPVHTVTTITSTGCNGPVHIDVANVILDVIHQCNPVAIWRSTPVVLDFVDEFLAVARRARELRNEHHEALLSPQPHVPPSAPGVTRTDLRPAMDHEHHGPLCVSSEVGWVVHECMDLVAIATLVPEGRSRVGLQKGELRVDFVGSENDLRLTLGRLLVEDAGRPAGGS